MPQAPPTVTVDALRTAGRRDDEPRNVLVVLTGTVADHRLADEAGRYVAHTGGRVVLLDVMSDRAFTDRQRTYARLGLRPWYGLDRAEETGRLAADRVGAATLRPLDVAYTPVGRVGRTVDQALTVAQTHDCGHVFLATRPLSLRRRVLGRDPARAVARAFDGLVTVVRASPDAAPPGTRPDRYKGAPAKRRTT